jgi:TatD DNase family protein
MMIFARSTETTLAAVSTSKRDSMITLEFARENGDCVKAFVGIHPSEAAKGEDLEWLDSAAKEAKGIGEIGLDPSYSEIGENSPQMKAFHAQLLTAERHSKPVQVHTRGAEAQCLDQLGTYSLATVHLHWFEGEPYASKASSMGCFASFGPAVIHSKKLQRIAAAYPEDLVLTETDGPVKFPSLVGAGGPWLVASVIFKLAELSHRSFDETAEKIKRNSLVYLAERGERLSTPRFGVRPKIG